MLLVLLILLVLLVVPRPESSVKVVHAWTSSPINVIPTLTITQTTTATSTSRTRNSWGHDHAAFAFSVGKQKYAPAKAALMRFVTRTQARKLEDAFDLELQKEALSAVDEALVLLGG